MAEPGIDDSGSESIAAWRVFLKGRVVQEQGGDQEAIEYFDQALALDPNNAYFLNAKAFAYSRLNQPAEALAAKVASQYGELAQRYVGENDKPDLWQSGIESILGEVEEFSRPSVQGRSVEMVW